MDPSLPQLGESRFNDKMCESHRRSWVDLSKGSTQGCCSPSTCCISAERLFKPRSYGTVQEKNPREYRYSLALQQSLMSAWMVYFISSFLFSLLVECSLSTLFSPIWRLEILDTIWSWLFSTDLCSTVNDHWSTDSYLKTWSPGPCSSLQQKVLDCHLNEHLFMTMTTWP